MATARRASRVALTEWTLQVRITHTNTQPRKVSGLAVLFTLFIYVFLFVCFFHTHRPTHTTSTGACVIYLCVSVVMLHNGVCCFFFPGWQMKQNLFIQSEAFEWNNNKPADPFAVFFFSLSLASRTHRIAARHSASHHASRRIKRVKNTGASATPWLQALSLKFLAQCLLTFPMSASLSQLSPPPPHTFTHTHTTKKEYKKKRKKETQTHQ